MWCWLLDRETQRFSEFHSSPFPLKVPIQCEVAWTKWNSISDHKRTSLKSNVIFNGHRVSSSQVYDAESAIWRPYIDSQPDIESELTRKTENLKQPMFQIILRWSNIDNSDDTAFFLGIICWDGFEIKFSKYVCPTSLPEIWSLVVEFKRRSSLNFH